MTQQEVLALMESSRSGEEWNENCDKVKLAFNGNYPSFWFPLILQSGAARRIMARFGESPDLTITTF